MMIINKYYKEFILFFALVQSVCYGVLITLLISSCSAKLPPGFTRKTLTESPYVENAGKNYTLHVDERTPVSQVRVNDVQEPFLRNSSDSIISLKSQESRPYFQLISGGDTATVTNREIDFKKPVNFRDLGGLKTMDGKMVRWGMIFRSDNLAKLKNSEFKKFNDLHIQTVYDLRTDHEIKGKEDHLPANVMYVHAPTVKDNEGQIAQLKNQVIGGKISEELAIKQTLQFYQESVTTNVASFRTLIEQITESEKPVLYHCSAGKDRTGIVSALIFSILNVDRKTIVQEYLMSNYYRRNKNKKTLGKAKLAKVIKPKMDLKAIVVFISVDERYINAVFDTIDKEYGGIDQFIKNQLGIDAAARKRIIEKFTY